MTRQNRSIRPAVPGRPHGFVTLTTALCLLALAGFSALAVDLGFLHMKRSDLQTAADASALAGATALASFKGDPAAIKAVVLEYARKNLSENDRPQAAVTEADVRLLRGGVPDPWNPDQVEVTLGLTQERGNPVSLFFGRIIGTDQADITATARAGLVETGSSRCVKPFLVPAKFQWNDQAEDPSSPYYGNGQLDLDSTAEMASIEVLGYSDADVGAAITLKYGSPFEAMANSHYNPVDLPPMNSGTPVTGAAAYKENLAGCTGSNKSLVKIGDELLLEPGNMVGPTDLGLRELLAQDPYAYWDADSGSVRGSDWPDPLNSPRVAIVAFYDPSRPPVSGRTSLFVHQMGAVFVEGQGAKGEIKARFMHTVARSPQHTETTNDSLLQMARLLLDSSRD